MAATLEQLARFAARHAEPGTIVLPNAWDPGSAVLMAEAGLRRSRPRAPGSPSPRGCRTAARSGAMR